jgi:hypothetical protein
MVRTHLLAELNGLSVSIMIHSKHVFSPFLNCVWAAYTRCTSMLHVYFEQSTVGSMEQGHHLYQIQTTTVRMVSSCYISAAHVNMTAYCCDSTAKLLGVDAAMCSLHSGFKPSNACLDASNHTPLHTTGKLSCIEQLGLYVIRNRGHGGSCVCNNQHSFPA